MKKTVVIAGALCLCFLCAFTLIHENVPPLVRLHVLAQSDSEADQAFKLRVRDAVLQTAREMLCECKSYEEARKIISERLGDIANSAQTAAGSVPTQTSLLKEHYPARDYGAFTLPEGNYTSLKVTIGAGEGRNWWCVVYPTLCMPEDQQVEQIGDILSQRPLRSAIADLLRGIRHRFLHREALLHA